MNIFFLDHDPSLCAQYHGDKHVRKMMIEYAQLLCNAHGNKDGMYKPTHLGNRYSKWVVKSVDHYRWLYNLWAALAEEYRYRFGKDHRSWTELYHPLLLPPAALMPRRWKDPPACDAMLGWSAIQRVEGYRMLYRGPKRHLAMYTRREAPAWLAE